MVNYAFADVAFISRKGVFESFTSKLRNSTQLRWEGNVILFNSNYLILSNLKTKKQSLLRRTMHEEPVDVLQLKNRNFIAAYRTKLFEYNNSGEFLRVNVPTEHVLSIIELNNGNLVLQGRKYVYIIEYSKFKVIETHKRSQSLVVMSLQCRKDAFITGSYLKFLTGGYSLMWTTEKRDIKCVFESEQRLVHILASGVAYNIIYAVDYHKDKVLAEIQVNCSLMKKLGNGSKMALFEKNQVLICSSELDTYGKVYHTIPVRGVQWPGAIKEIAPGLLAFQNGEFVQAWDVERGRLVEEYKIWNDTLRCFIF
jgi:hypothetical protein